MNWHPTHPLSELDETSHIFDSPKLSNKLPNSRPRKPMPPLRSAQHPVGPVSDRRANQFSEVYPFAKTTWRSATNGGSKNNSHQVHMELLYRHWGQSLTSFLKRKPAQHSKPLNHSKPSTFRRRPVVLRSASHAKIGHSPPETSVR
jgi:hypothetical protein